MNSSLDPLVDINGLSNVLGLSVASVRWHIRKGRIRAVRVGRRLLFDPKEVVMALKEVQPGKFTGSPSVHDICSRPMFFEKRMKERTLVVPKRRWR